MRRFGFVAIAIIVLVLIPELLNAQGLPQEIRGMNGILDKLFKQFMPKCRELIASAQAVAGFGAIFYIGYRVWKHIANAEPIDFFPLFRPFVLTWCILFFPNVINVMEGVLSPTKTGTQRMVDKTNASVKVLIEQRQEALKGTKDYKMYGVNDGEGDRDVWMTYTHPKEVGKENWLDSLGNDVQFAVSKAYYGLKTWFKDFIFFLLQLLYEAAALCINTMRTFNLLICALLGPFVFGLAVFDGFQHSLTVWLARYVNFYLWLPISNILSALLGTIHEEMVKLDLSQIAQHGETFFTKTDLGYSIFMIIGILCYFTVPSLANLVVNSGSGSAITAKITSLGRSTVGMTAGIAGAGVGMSADALGDANLMMTRGVAGHARGSGYFKNKLND